VTAGVRKPSHLRPDGTCAPVSCAFRLREFCRTSNTVMVGTLSYSGCAEMSCRYTDAASATSRDRAPTYGPTLPSPPPRQQLSAHGLRPILGLCSAISALWPLMARNGDDGRRPGRPVSGAYLPRGSPRSVALFDPLQTWVTRGHCGAAIGGFDRFCQPTSPARSHSLCASPRSQRMSREPRHRMMARAACT
jgi:hypothetical protein